MSKPIRRLSLAVAATALLAAVLAAPVVAAPIVTTDPATNVTQSKATLNATIDTGGKEALYGFEYGLEPNSGKGTQGKRIKKGTKGPVAVSATIEGLQPGTTYYYRIGVTDGGAPVFGETLSFTTLEEQIPHFEAEKYPATISGSQDSSDKLTFSIGGAEAVCNTADPSGAVDRARTRISLGASFSKCEFLEESATVTMNTCKFRLHVANVAPPYSGSVAIVCSKAGDAIEISAESCTVEIPAQSLGGSVSYENQGNGSSRAVGATIADADLAYDTLDGQLCFLLEGAGSLQGSVTLSASNGGNPNGFFIGGEGIASAGVFVTNDGFAAESYPETVLGEALEDKVTLFESAGGAASCSAAEWSGSLSAQSPTLSLGAIYADCEFLEEPATVSTGTCDYVLNVANAGSPYSGSSELACEEGGAILIASNACTVMIPGQSFTGGVAYTNEGTGSNRAVNASVSATEVEYSKSGPLCFLIGDGTDGTFGFDLRLYGLN